VRFWGRFYPPPDQAISKINITIARAIAAKSNLTSTFTSNWILGFMADLPGRGAPST
jgi:hypothetical protein